MSVQFSNSDSLGKCCEQLANRLIPEFGSMNNEVSGLLLINCRVCSIDYFSIGVKFQPTVYFVFI